MAAKMTKQKFSEMLGFLRWYAGEESSGRLGKAADMLEWARDIIFGNGNDPQALALEYVQVSVRAKQMEEMLERWDELEPGPKCMMLLWNEQWQAMLDYKECLRKRGKNGEFDLEAAEQAIEKGPVSG